MARFDLREWGETWHQYQQYAHCIKHISKERIAIELGKLFSKGKSLSRALNLMKSSTLWERIFFEIGCPNIDAMDTLPQDFDIRMAAIFSYGKLRSDKRDRVEVAEEIIDELKLTSAGLDKKKVLMLVANSRITQAGELRDRRLLRKFISNNLNGKVTNFFELMKVWAFVGVLSNAALADLCSIAATIEREKDPLTIRDLAINGNDLQSELGVEGKTIGEMLKVSLELVLDEPGLNNKKDLLFFAHEFIYGKAI